MVDRLQASHLRGFYIVDPSKGQAGGDLRKDLMLNNRMMDHIGGSLIDHLAAYAIREVKM